MRRTRLFCSNRGFTVVRRMSLISFEYDPQRLPMHQDLLLLVLMSSLLTAFAFTIVSLIAASTYRLSRWKAWSALLMLVSSMQWLASTRQLFNKPDRPKQSDQKYWPISWRLGTDTSLFAQCFKNGHTKIPSLCWFVFLPATITSETILQIVPMHPLSFLCRMV